MQISPKLKQFIDGPHGMNIGTRDAGLNPEYARVLGTRVVDDQHIHVFFDGKSSGRTFPNLENNRLLALVLVSVENFESYQLKGISLSWRESNAEELQWIDAYLKNINVLLNKMGMPENAIYNYPHVSMVTLLMEVEEIFEQTPKAGTGKKVIL